MTIETVIVGDPGNAPDKIYSHNNPDNLQFGSVSYQYRIGKYEVTNSQYVEFLNAKAKSDPNLLYNTEMEANAAGGINGRKIKYVLEDDGYVTARTIQGVKKVTDVDKAFAMLGISGSGQSIAVMPLLEKAGIPTVIDRMK